MQITNVTTGVSASDGLALGVGTTGDGYLWLAENQKMAFATNNTEQLTITAGGDVGINALNPRGKLDVNGVILGKAAVPNGGATIDFATGNTQFTTASCGPFTFHNMKDGGNYTFAVKGSTPSTCTFSAFSGTGTGALTFHYPTGHGSTIGSTHTLYNFIVVGGDVYASWSPGL